MPENVSSKGHAETAPRPSLLHSPWYWAYAFCAAGLVALVLIGGKFSQRQSQIERQHQGRQRASRIEAATIENEEQSPEHLAELSTPDSTIVSLAPLYALLGAAFVVSWAALWWTHFRHRRIVAASSRGKAS
jgi:hypothetical protein